jgi:hypothetical protein
VEESVFRGLFSSPRGSEVSTRSVDSLSSNTIRTYRDCLWYKSTIDTKLTMMIDQNHPMMQAFGRTLNRDKGGARLIVFAGRDWSIETLQMSKRCLGYEHLACKVFDQEDLSEYSAANLKCIRTPCINPKHINSMTAPTVPLSQG